MLPAYGEPFSWSVLPIETVKFNPAREFCARDLKQRLRSEGVTGIPEDAHLCSLGVTLNALDSDVAYCGFRLDLCHRPAPRTLYLDSGFDALADDGNRPRQTTDLNPMTVDTYCESLWNRPVAAWRAGRLLTAPGYLGEVTMNHRMLYEAAKVAINPLETGNFCFVNQIGTSRFQDIMTMPATRDVLGACEELAGRFNVLSPDVRAELDAGRLFRSQLSSNLRTMLENSDTSRTARFKRWVGSLWR